jgi:hypothetical protein
MGRKSWKNNCNTPWGCYKRYTNKVLWEFERVSPFSTDGFPKKVSHTLSLAILNKKRDDEKEKEEWA